MTDDLNPAALRRAVEELSPEKRALLSSRLADRQTAGTTMRALPRGTGVQRFPASPGQERLYFLHQLAPAAPVHLLPFMVRLTGKLRPEALALAWDTMVERHEILRTGFEVDPREGLTQAVRPAGSVELELTTREIDADEVESRVAALVTEPFDLSSAPLARATLWRLRGRDDEWVLALCVHHIIVDGWSIGVLVDELVQAYTAVVTGSPSPLRPLPVQYADFAHWQRNWLSSDSAREQLDYWHGALAGTSRLLLPTDRPRDAGQATIGEAVPFRLDRELTAKLEALARSEQSTVFMVLLTALCSVLGRWADQDDMVVATPVAGRPTPEVERLVGFFVNTVPIRVELGTAVSFRDLLRRTRASCLASYEHQDIPVERIVQKVDGERHGGRSTLFNVMLALRNVPIGTIDLPEVEAEVIDFPPTSTDFDLTLELAPDGTDGLRGWLVYSANLFDPATVERIAAGVRETLSAAAASPDSTLSGLPVVSPEEHALLVEEFSGRTASPLTSRPLLAWFDDHVTASPAAPAVTAGGETLTFAELDERADRLAHWLRRTGVGVEDKVGVCLNRDLNLIVSLVAVLKIGAVFVPLEADQPRERIAMIVADACPGLVLTTSSIDAELDLATRTIRLDEVDLGTGRVDLSGVAVAGLNAAYVLYTSGSTGVPKGVVITREGLANRVHGMCAEFGFNRDDKVLHRTPLSADTAMWELLVPLFCGGELVMAEKGRHVETPYLYDTMSLHGITTCFFVPSALRLVLASPGFDSAARTLRLLICAGEELPAELSERVIALAPHTKLINSYGPTEATINVAEHWVTTPVPTPVPIGRPVPGADLYVLDDSMRVRPIGVPGDLVAGGAQLARGYLARPARTAEAYVPHPFRPGERLYRTGDRARWRTDGALEFLGRVDNQVKVRGYRVELGEVEATLRGHEDVVEAVVLPQTDSRSELRLMAYLTARDGLLPSAASLRTHMAKFLPSPMIPSVFVTVDSFPLTGYGKVDRGALSTTAAKVQPTEAARVTPSDALQEVLAAIWSRVLDVPRVGVRDDFFTLGGHSLLATLVVAQIRDLFRLELPMRFFVDAPSIAELAELLRSHGARQGVDVDRVAALILTVERMAPADVESALTDPTAP
ncbi:non-ribosomal peptide synthetase [Nocardiopsis ansamitocini]|uniref:Non-ribosomal peptide synthetase n=1 Tax=Nocardiopsis ansamitocini TaxID=1670832 RepID=A0A9W6P742_9ACTN|nr:amino acid adenylation domain-containing protein [Nocardiopsis ansamitocini]GLU48689.1 non-ribosomal peptide synthetase [Nocardiopsis ansamitocini]